VTDNARFRRLEEAFHRFADLRGSDREGALDALRQSDPDLADEVARLLQRDAARNQPPLDRVGPYRLVRKLGAGGMGEVWEATQEEPVRRRVAVKLVRSGLGGNEVLQRFRAEREALARMSHPGIAQVFDAGIAPDGRPFVVMELVDGEPITLFSSRSRLDVRARLELLSDVCHAVHHAHQKGVIHRDLKPTNILVTVRDGRPQPKVIDFGIARAAVEDDPATRLTRFGDVLGTLEYMSPEQAAGGAASVDTRSDVYALGVLLYELLTGELPLAPADFAREGLEAALRQIREVEPPKPSVRVTTTAPGTAATRGGDRATLRRTLRGDLDWITMKALSKEPGRRYPSASELAADLERHLHVQPVLAGPPSLGYRLGKLARRHRLAVVSGALLAAAIAAGVVGTALGLVRARAAEREARLEAFTAEEVSTFLVDLFRASEPAQARGVEVTARELLADGAARARTDLGEAPAVRLRLLRTLGEVYDALGEHGLAAELLEEARVSEDVVGVEIPGEERVLTRLALARAQRGLDDLEAAARSLDAARRLLDSSSAPDHSARLAVLRERADLAATLGDTERARDLLEQAVAIARASPTEPAEVAMLEGTLGFVEYQDGRFEVARDLYARALASLEETFGSDHPDVAVLLNQLAVSEKRLGNLERALELHTRGLEVDERVLGASHPDTGQRLQNLSRLLVALGRPGEAAVASERAVAIHEAANGADHRMTIAAINGLAGAYSAGEEVGAARRAWTTALARMAARPDTFYGYLPLRVARNLAALERREGRPQVAAAVCRDALAGPAAARYERQRAEVEIELATALHLVGTTDEADELAGSALAVLEADDALDPWGASLQRARYLAVTGDAEAARRSLSQAVAAGADRSQLRRDPDLANLAVELPVG
jgi:serine/threonine protein kinase/tetratricopeptide (TPR) repeat protein